MRHAPQALNDPHPLLARKEKIMIAKVIRSQNLMQRLAWVYAVMFFIVGSLRYFTFLNAPDGSTLGIFSLQWYDDLLHYASGVWAAVAGWRSPRASTLYFKLFGLIYFFDGVMGFLFGQGYLDGGIFIKGITAYDWGHKLFANLPHLTIGGLAIFIGFVVSKKFAEHA